MTRALLAGVRACTRATGDAAARQQAFLLVFDWSRGFFAAPPPAPCAVPAAAPSGAGPPAFDFAAPADFPTLCAVMVEGLTDVWSATRKGCAGRLFGVIDGMSMAQVRVRPRLAGWI